MVKTDRDAVGGRGQRPGLYAALAFYLLAIIMVTVNNSEGIMDKDLNTLTFAHWQLEDGFREGYEEAIRRFRELKAKEGVKVEIVQTTVPVRGYKQWFLTQLIGGSPADVIELSGSSEQRNQYFVPLSQYVGASNSFNRGTKFENTPWKDTFIDGMDSALDTTFGEYFGVGTFTALTRVYVNMDLLRKATGKSDLPENLEEWLTVCEKMRQYGEKTGNPIIPVGVRGFDKATLNFLLTYYLNQMNCDLNDYLSRRCSPTALNYEILDAMLNGKVDSKRFYAVADILKDIGNYFGEGFVATDLEQTKFLFFSGNVGFFPEGSWNAYSMVNNSPFEVKIMQVPAIGRDHKYSKYFVGLTSEEGRGVGGLFGIPKACKNFELALEFLQFITSWEINQMVMVDHCRWPPAVKDTEYRGLLSNFKPITGVGRKSLPVPFMLSGKSKRKLLESLEDIIITQPENPIEIFENSFRHNIPGMIEEAREATAGSLRALFSIEGQRSAIAVARLRNNMKESDRNKLDFKAEINGEFTISRFNSIYDTRSLEMVLKKFQDLTQARKKMD